MIERRRPARWKRWNDVPLTFVLSRAGERLATCQRNRDGTWFSYSSRHNTAGRPVATLDEAKAQALTVVNP